MPPHAPPDDRRPTTDRAGPRRTASGRLAERPMIAILAVLAIVMLIAGIGLVRRSATSPRVVPVADHQPTTSMAPAPARFAITQIEANGTAPPSAAVVDAVVAQLGTWANAGIVDPLRAGTAPPPLAELFTPGAQTAARTSERGTLFVDGVPRSTVAVESASAALTTVAGPDAGVAVIVAAVELRLLAEGDAHGVRIVREGEIVLVPEADGVWRIDGWRLHAAEEPVT